MSPTIRAAMVRLGITFVICMVFAFVVAEISYQTVKNKYERAPRTIEIFNPPRHRGTDRQWTARASHAGYAFFRG